MTDKQHITKILLGKKKGKIMAQCSCGWNRGPFTQVAQAMDARDQHKQDVK